MSNIRFNPAYRDANAKLFLSIFPFNSRIKVHPIPALLHLILDASCDGNAFFHEKIYVVTLSKKFMQV